MSIGYAQLFMLNLKIFQEEFPRLTHEIIYLKYKYYVVIVTRPITKMVSRNLEHIYLYLYM